MGTGRVRREFLHVDDMADATIFALEVGLESGLYNVGCGSDVTIEELAREAMQAVGFNGRIEFDTTKPDGTLRNCSTSACSRSSAGAQRSGCVKGWRRRIRNSSSAMT
jgi:nucleoside-diphosphate-sugar epimerase